MTDLVSLVLNLNPITPVPERPLPGWWGHAAQAFFLQVIANADPAAAKEQHDSQLAPAFTVSSLLGFSARRGLAPDGAYALRITTLTASLSAMLLEAAAPGGSLAAGAQIELDHIPFRVHSTCLETQEHPWAGTSTYNSLASAHLLAGGAVSRRLALRFSSPVAFKSREMHVPLPLPGLVFGSLLDKWNAYAPLAFPAELRRFAEECLALSSYRLGSRNVEVKEGVRRSGGVGDVTYVAVNYDRYWLGMLHTLAHFAFFAGAGIGTAMGMGQCRLQRDGEAPAEKLD